MLRFLVAGMIIGPHIPVPLVADPEMVSALSELGVILLMFSIGLEFNLRKLLAVGGPAGIVAVAQSAAMVGLGYLVGRVAGWTPAESLFTGAIIAISSTTIIARAFAEQGVRGRVADIVLGILIVEDLIAIFLVAILTAVGEGGGLSPREFAATTLRLVLFLAGLIGVGLLVVPRLVRAVVRFNRPETTLVTVIGVCFAASLLALSLGYSVALGAFIAGALVAESGQERRIEPLVAPVRDLFVAVFFVAVGMLLDPAVVLEYWWIVTALVLLVIAGKVLAVSSGVFLIGEGLRPAVQAGMSLAQIGEFSFIIAAVGLSTGATREFLYPVAVAVCGITTLTTPYLIRSAPRAAALVDASLPGPLQTFVALYGSWIEQLRSTTARQGGTTRTRRLVRVMALDTVLLAALLIGLAIEFPRLVALLDGRLGLSPVIARVVVLVVAAALATPLVIGLVRSTQLLGLALAVRALPAPEARKVDLARAPRRALEVTLQFALLFSVVALLVAVTQPFAPRIPAFGLIVVAGAVFFLAVWRSARNLQGHAHAGAEVIVAALTRQMAESGAGADMDRAMERMHAMLPGLGEPVAMTVAEGSRAANHTLRELDLRGATGATVLAVVRGDEQTLAPRGSTELRAGDLIAVAGTHDAVQQVRGIVSDRQPEAEEQLPPASRHGSTDEPRTR